MSSHVSQRVIKWIGEVGKGAEGNVHLTLCGVEVTETRAPGPFVNWAGWRADCPVCLEKSASIWRPWVEKVFKLAQMLNDDLYNNMKIDYAESVRRL